MTNTEVFANSANVPVRRIEDVICELWEFNDYTIMQIFNLINFYDDGSRVRDVNGNIVPEYTRAFIRQVIATHLP